MSILNRFTDIISSNINAVLNRMEDPEKMIDEYLRQLLDDLAEVKSNTAEVMAEESRAKRKVDENEAEILKYENFAKKAIQAGNDEDARVFLTKKQELEELGTGLAKAYATAHENASKMRQMHDKLATDIETLRHRRNMLKTQASVADTQEKLNKANDLSGSSQDARANFQRMEEKISNRLDKAQAMEELNEGADHSVKNLEEKYSQSTASASVESELEQLKQAMADEDQTN